MNKLMSFGELRQYVMETRRPLNKKYDDGGVEKDKSLPGLISAH